MNFFSSRFQTIAEFLSSQQLLPPNFWHDIFSWGYWTESDLDTSSPYALTFTVGFFILLAGLIWWRWRLKKAQAATPVFTLPINQLLNLIWLVIIMSLLYLFFRSQAISYFGSRLVVLVTGLIVVAWIIYLAIYTSRIGRKKRDEYLEKERFFRYLPKKKQ